MEKEIFHFIAFSYIDIDDDDILFSMSSPIDYPLNLDNRNILTGTVTINDTNSWNVIVTDTRPYAIGSNDEYVKIKIKNTSDVNLYYSFYYMGANTLNIPELNGGIVEINNIFDFIFIDSFFPSKILSIQPYIAICL